MKKIALLVCLLAGCAALRGQAKYTGTGTEPTIKERIIRYPEMPRPGMRSGQNETKDSEPYVWNEERKQKEAMANYWTLPADKAGTVENPLDKAINAHVVCFASFPSTVDMTVPAHTSQDFTFTTNAQYMYEKLCKIASYEVVEETK